jgi:hypothetical protein
MMRETFLRCAVLLALGMCLATSGNAQPPPTPQAAKPAKASKKAKAPNIEPRAAQVLKHMTDYLQGLQQFSVQAEITEDVLLDSGLTIQDGRSVTASVRRPNRLRADAVGDLGDRQLFYDGKTITLMDLSTNVYSTIDVPPEIDTALHHAIQAYNLRAPLADLIYAKAYDYLMEGTRAGFYLGLSKVQGHLCHHLAFRQQDIDWQIWIEDGPTPLPRKFLITDKQAKGLQFTAWLSQWNTAPQLEDGLFTFVVPAKAEQVALRPVAAPVRPKKTKK